MRAFTTRVFLDLIDCDYTTELYAAVRRSSIYLCTSAMYFCCCSVRRYTAVVAAAAAVRHRVTDGKFCCCGSFHMIPMFSFSSFKHGILITYVPLAVLSHLQPRFAYSQ